jgi:hypothetical protein
MVRPAASGTELAPIRFVAASGSVDIDASGSAVGLKLIGVQWVSFDGFTVTGASAQGVYVADARSVELKRLTVDGNGTYGIQVGGAGIRISQSTISGNGMAGIAELAAATGNVYEQNTITENGRDGKPFNGDGIQLNGEGADVRANTIDDNGDAGIYEHGIYAGRSASDYVIESNALTGNAASDIKAAGSSGIVRYNRLGNSRLGLVFSDERSPVSAYSNLIVGRFQHAVFFTAGATGARARLWGNTIVQTGRLGSRGDASAIFVSSADLADIRNNLVSYAGRAGDGVALFVKRSSLPALASDANWFSDRDPSRRVIAVDGVRTTLSGWSTPARQDAASLASRPPAFDADFRVVSRNLGAHRGESLQLDRDFKGTAIPRSRPDIGAYQTA